MFSMFADSHVMAYCDKPASEACLASLHKTLVSFYAPATVNVTTSLARNGDISASVNHVYVTRVLHARDEQFYRI